MNRMTDDGKRLIDLLTLEGKQYGKYWITPEGYSKDRKEWFLDGFLTALQIVQAYYGVEDETNG